MMSSVEFIAPSPTIALRLQITQLLQGRSQRFVKRHWRLVLSHIVNFVFSFLVSPTVFCHLFEKAISPLFRYAGEELGDAPGEAVLLDCGDLLIGELASK